jgi:hypothetical protein
MYKENESIYLFIIEEEYKRNKRNQDAHEDLLGKAKLPILTEQNHAAVLQELEKMHPTYEVIQEPKRRQRPKRHKQTVPTQIAEPPNTPDDLDLLESCPKNKSRRKRTARTKIRPINNTQQLYNKLIEEIEKKKTAINNLKTEINRCKELTQALESSSTISVL